LLNWLSQRTDSLYSDLRALNIRKCSMCIVMETNELPSIDDKLVDTSTIHTTNFIYSLLNISSMVAGSTARRRPAIQPQGPSRIPHMLSSQFWAPYAIGPLFVLSCL